MRIDRMLAITVMLLNRQRISARELADKFEVSVRTIYRDIDAINLAGIPVVSYSGNNGGFGIMENYKIDRQVLTLNDMVALLSALKGISTSMDYRELDTAIEKINSLLPRDRNGGGMPVTEQLVIDILPWGFRKKQKEYLQLVHRAIYRLQLLEFSYKNSRGEEKRRVIEPMTLLFKGYAWYLFGYCRMKKDFRIFRLSRISGLNTMEEGFVRRDVSYRAYMQEDEAATGMVDLIIRFAPRMRYRVEDYFDENQITVGEDGSVTVRASFPEDEWIYSMLLSYGENAEVIAPRRVRDLLREKSKKICALYKPDTVVSRS